jgi:ABC-2 type transport system ATP-binding protein
MATPTPTGVTPLEARGARRSFGADRGLDGVDLRLERGEVYGLLGPNGAGKTSLVRALCGRLRLDAGSVRLLGRDPRDAEARRGLGLVPQQIALYPELTVAENLELLGRLAGLPAAEAGPAVKDALGWIGLADRAASLVGTLSGGQQRRVNLAAATLHRPAVLLLDEPTVGVDPAAREQIHERLRDLRARGIAILLATHDMDQAAELCSRIGILVDGRIRAEGTLAELVRRAFGDAREMRVSLASPPGDDARRALAADGLAAGADERTWSGPLAVGLDALPAIARRLTAAGVPFLELRLREPGLRGAFFRLTGRELGE